MDIIRLKKRLDRFKTRLSKTKPPIGKEMDYTYHGGFDVGWLAGTINEIENQIDDLQPELSKDLTQNDCQHALSKEIIIATGITRKSNKPKRFTFNIWENEYIIYVDNVYFTGGQALEELICEYNEIDRDL